MARARITKLLVDRSNPKGRDYFIWDTELHGFGFKVSKGGRKSYVCQYRSTPGRGHSKRLTIGAHGSPWTAETARTEAKKILGQAANHRDPAEEKQNLKRRLTVAELCDSYLANGCATKKISTLMTDRGRIERHIKPLLGRRKVQDVTRADVKQFLQDVARGKTAADIKTRLFGRARVRGGEGTATRTVGLLGGIFSYAIDCRMIEANPVAGVKRYVDRKNARYLSQHELVALGDALKNAEANGDNVYALTILKLLIFTGARKGEIEKLKWSEVDLEAGYLHLITSKTGQKSIPLNAVAIHILREQARRRNCYYVFPAYRGEGCYQGLPKIWERIRTSAGLHHVRIHDLRHSFASIAVSRGASLPMIGALLGHTDTATTQRYAHLSNDPLRAATEAVGSALAAAILGVNVLEDSKVAEALVRD